MMTTTRMHARSNKNTNGNRSAFISPYLGLAVLILFGVILGALQSIHGNSGLHVFAQELFSKSAAARGFADLFFSSFFSTAILLCAAFICGICAVGALGIILIALFKGAGIGLAMGAIYIQYGMSGFMICALFILPWALITSFSIVIACREGFSFSIYLAKNILSSGNTHLWQTFQLYCMRFVICFGLAVLAAVVEAGTTVAFSALFLT
ncbi:MAG TPA: hypothetical protein DEP42_07580 [Ruminococcaceae bacterium]|nr:hypothetical protein [Oscillospiraceae bacterium]